MAEAAIKVDDVGWQPLIDKAKSKLLEEVEWRQNAAASFISPQGKISFKQSVCHHILRGHPAKFIINGLQDGDDYGDNIGRILPKEVEVWYLDWLLNRSPYADAFITKDAVKALEERIVVSSGDHAGNYIGGSIVSLRLLWEHTYAAQAAYDLHQAGVAEHLAFLLGHTIQVERKIKEDSVTEWSANTSWHSSIDVGCMGFKGIKAFFKHKPTYVSDNIYSKAGQYEGYSRMYQSEGESLTDCIRHNFPFHLYKDGPPPPTSTNPFMASKKVLEVNHALPGISAPYNKAIKVMAEWAKTHLMEKINNV